MFKGLLDGWKAKRLCTALRAASAHLEIDDWESAKKWLGIAEHFSKTATIHRRLLIDAIVVWGFIAATLHRQGRKVASDQSHDMMNALQAKFDAGDYYADSPGAVGLFDD